MEEEQKQGERKVELPSSEMRWKKTQDAKAVGEQIIAARKQLLASKSLRIIEIQNVAQSGVQISDEVMLEFIPDSVGSTGRSTANGLKDQSTLVKKKDFNQHLFWHERLKFGAERLKKDDDYWLKWWDSLVGYPENLRKKVAQPIDEISADTLAVILENEALLGNDGIDLLHMPEFAYVPGVRTSDEESRGLAGRPSQLTYTPQIGAVPNQTFQILLSRKRNGDKENNFEQEQTSIQFTEEEAAWWGLLLDQQRAFEKRSELKGIPEPELKRYFRDFLSEISALQLELPPLLKDSICVKSVSSMPIALARILSILKNPGLHSVKERQAQFDLIPQLSLANDKAVLALRFKSPARFVVPEIIPQSSAEGWPSPVSQEDPSSIIPKGIEGKSEGQKSQDQKSAPLGNSKAFWNYVAYQQKGLPLDFYLQKDSSLNLIEKSDLDEEGKAYLYACLASVSTNTGLIFGSTPETIREKFSIFCKQLDTAFSFPLNNPERKKELLKKIWELKKIPPIELLNEIFNLMKAFIAKGDHEGITEAFKRLNWTLEQAEGFGLDPAGVYYGMRDSLQKKRELSPKNKPKDSYFFVYLDILKEVMKLCWEKKGEDARAILSQGGWVERSKATPACRFSDFLIKNHAIFQLKKEDIRSLFNASSTHRILKAAQIKPNFPLTEILSLFDQANFVEGCNLETLQMILDDIANVGELENVDKIAYILRFIEKLEDRRGVEKLEGKKEEKEGVQCERDKIPATLFPTGYLEALKNRYKRDFAVLFRPFLLKHQFSEDQAAEILTLLGTYRLSTTPPPEDSQLQQIISCFGKLKNFLQPPLRFGQILSQWNNYLSKQRTKCNIEKDIELLKLVDEKNVFYLESILDEGLKRGVNVGQKLFVFYKEILPWWIKNREKGDVGVIYPMVLEILLSASDVYESGEVLDAKKETGSPSSKPLNVHVAYYDRIFKIIKEETEAKKEYNPISSLSSAASSSSPLPPALLQSPSTVSAPLTSVLKKSGLEEDVCKFFALAAEDIPKFPVEQFHKDFSVLLAWVEEAHKHLEQYMLRKLLYCYSDTQKLTKKPSDLLKIIQKSDALIKSKKAKQFYVLLAKLSGKTDENNQDILTHENVGQINAENIDAIETCYKAPPYRSLKTILQEISKQKQPAASFRRDSKNKITLYNLQEKAKEFLKIPIKNAQKFYQLIKFFEAKSTTEKLQTLKELRGKFSKKPLTKKEQIFYKTELAALLGTLSYDLLGEEFNHTQFLVLLNSILSENPITHQISTGEGKTRILRALCAAQCVQGKAVDFVTSSFVLARRDFYASEPFFDACEIPTQLVENGSKKHSYFCEERVGVNFSSPEKLNLFLNENIEQDPAFAWNKNKVLVLDEADLSYFDLESHAINYAAPTQKKNDAIEKIFHLAVKFVERSDFQENYLCSQHIEFSNVYDIFCKFLSENGIAETIEDVDIERWLRAAYISGQLKEGIHYEIRKNQNRLTEKGMQFVSLAIVKHNNQLLFDSTFSEAVHQCLHARLNNKREQALAPLNARNVAADVREEALVNAEKNIIFEKYGKTPFNIEPESHIVYSTTASLWLNSYEHVLGMTGTVGSEAEREVLKAKIPKMQIVDVAPHEPSKRKDFSAQIVKDSDAQKQFLFEKAKKAAEKDRPVLIICENDPERLAVFKYFQGQTGIGSTSLQTLDENLSNTEYHAKVIEAGEPGKITIATNLAGRGTDIVTNAASGLCVLATYLPKTRDERQIFGRAGRQGQEGSARLILDKSRLPKSDNKKEYENVDAYFEDLRQRAEKQDIRTTAILEFKNYYYGKLQSHFYARTERAKFKKDWADFIEEFKGQWNVIFAQVSDPGKGIEEVTGFLKNFVEKNYEAYSNKTGLSLAIKPGDLDNKLKSLKARLEMEIQPSVQKPKSEWTPAHAGKGFTYNRFFATRRGLWREIWRAKTVSEGFSRLLDYIFPSRVETRAREQGRVLDISLQPKSSNMRASFAKVLEEMRAPPRPLTSLREKIGDCIAAEYESLSLENAASLEIVDELMKSFDPDTSDYALKSTASGSLERAVGFSSSKYQTKIQEYLRDERFSLECGLRLLQIALPYNLNAQQILSKKELKDAIDSYHENKGLSRKWLPFLPSETQTIKDLTTLWNLKKDGDPVYEVEIELCTYARKLRDSTSFFRTKNTKETDSQTEKTLRAIQGKLTIEPEKAKESKRPG